MTNGAARLLKRREDPRTTFLELVFDLVFVAAFARLSQGLLEHLNWTGAFQTLVLLLAVWAVWSHTASLTNRFDPAQPLIQVLVIATMLGILVMAAAVLDAFRHHGWVFAGVYVTVQIGRNVVVVAIGRGEVQRGFLRPLIWLSVSAVAWIAGAAAHDTARGALWALAAAMDYVALALGFPTPGLGRSRATKLGVSGEHLAARYSQLFIIALGELILVAALTFRRTRFEAHHSGGVVVAFAATTLLWRIYLHRAGALLAQAISAARDPVRLAVLANFTHLIMVAGVITIAVGAELIIEQPFGHTQPAWLAAILGGPALFIVGRAAFEYAVFGRVSRSRLIGILVLAAISPAMRLVPPLIAALGAVLVLAAIAVSDEVRSRKRPHEPPSPPAPSI